MSRPARRAPAAAPLREREFRLLFLGRVTSLVGSALAPVALAFAVLELTGSATSLGLVLAARMVPQVVFLLVGGIWADRLPRNLVMVGSNLTSAAAQAAVAALLLLGVAELWHLIVLQLVAGASSAFFFPAAQGIVPQTVPADMLQGANALLRLSMSTTQIGGAAAGGILVAAVGSGWALAFDAVTYAVAAALLGAMRLPPSVRAQATNFVGDLRDGWREFSSRTWLWAITIAFALLNAGHSAGSSVLGPVVAREELGGAAAWGLILAAEGVGLVVGGLLMLRFRARRILLVACAAVALEIPGILLLAFGVPTLVLAAAYLLAGIGIEIFGVYWDLALQQNIPHEALSRVYSYDALGSFVLIPVALAVVGPLAAAVGRDETLYLIAAVLAVCVAAMLLVRDVRTLERRALTPSP